MTMSSEPRPIRPFNPNEKDCFARYINRTDDNVTDLITALRDMIGNQGEYDQDDAVTIPFDEAADLAFIAEKLWAHRIQNLDDLRRLAGLGEGSP